MTRPLNAFLLIFALYLGGCATDMGIVKLGPDTFTLVKADHGGVFGNANTLRLTVIEQANSFAESQGKIAYPISARTHPMGVCCGDWATFEYQFRLVAKGDTAVRKTFLLPDSDVVTDDEGKIVANGLVNIGSDKPTDRYANLVKLDDLRKKGIITDAEFEAEKKKLLGAN